VSNASRCATRSSPSDAARVITGIRSVHATSSLARPRLSGPYGQETITIAFARSRNIRPSELHVNAKPLLHSRRRTPPAPALRAPSHREFVPSNSDKHVTVGWPKRTCNTSPPQLQ
jgi:hypothetical protein